MHQLYILSTQSRIILPVLNSGFFAYLHEWFLSLIACIEMVVRPKRCSGIW